MNVTVYSTHCPQCKMLEMQLKKKNIEFDTVYGAEEIEKRGYHSAPIMEVDGKTMSFAEAVRWVKDAEAIPSCASCVIGGDSDAG